MFALSGGKTAYHWVDLSLQFLPIVASFAILFIGSWLTVGARRREWLADNQKAEYQRVLAAMNHLHMVIMSHLVGNILIASDITEVINETIAATNDCIFIYDFLERTRVVGDIIDASKQALVEKNMPVYQRKHWHSLIRLLRQQEHLRFDSAMFDNRYLKSRRTFRTLHDYRYLCSQNAKIDS
jgi:hypothetical protein